MKRKTTPKPYPTLKPYSPTQHHAMNQNTPKKIPHLHKHPKNVCTHTNTKTHDTTLL